MLCLVLLLLISLTDSLRFAQKFTPFTTQAYLYPNTKALTYLQQHLGINRYMTNDSQILPPNFSTIYHLQTVDGYDPLYLMQYGEYIAASERKQPDIHAPFGFNRILTPHNISSRLMNLAGVQYILSLQDIKDKQFTKVFEEGKTKIYKNTKSIPRIFFVQSIIEAPDNNTAIKKIFDNRINLSQTAIVESASNSYSGQFASGTISNISYEDNKITLTTVTAGDAFLVLTDNYYPTWKAKVCTGDIDTDCSQTQIIKTDYTFRGIRVPSGKHTVVFYNTLL